MARRQMKRLRRHYFGLMQMNFAHAIWLVNVLLIPWALMSAVAYAVLVCLHILGITGPETQAIATGGATITGLAADSSLARGTNPRLQRRIAAVVAMFGGAVLGSITLRHSVFMALAFSVVLSSLCSLALLISSRLPCTRSVERG